MSRSISLSFVCILASLSFACCGFNVSFSCLHWHYMLLSPRSFLFSILFFHCHMHAWSARLYDVCASTLCSCPLWCGVYHVSIVWVVLVVHLGVVSLWSMLHATFNINNQQNVCKLTEVNGTSTNAFEYVSIFCRYLGVS